MNDNSELQDQSEALEKERLQKRIQELETELGKNPVEQRNPVQNPLVER